MMVDETTNENNDSQNMHAVEFRASAASLCKVIETALS